MCINGCDAPVKYRGLCGPCYRKDRREANLDKAREQERARAQRQRDLRSETLNARKRAEYEADPEKFKKRVSANRVKHITKERERERIKGAKYRANNPEKMRELVRIASKRWRKENPLKNREKCRRRRYRIAGSVVDYAAILAEHGMVCHLCGDDIQMLADLHMDHVIPLSTGGAHHADNIRPAHAFCNLSKGARAA